MRHNQETGFVKENLTLERHTENKSYRGLVIIIYERRKYADENCDWLFCYKIVLLVIRLHLCLGNFFI